MVKPYYSSHWGVQLTLHKRPSEPFHFESCDNLRQHAQILHKHHQRGGVVAAYLKSRGRWSRQIERRSGYRSLMCFRRQIDGLVSSFSSIESAYESTGEVEEPGFWLQRERICDVVIIGHSEECLRLLFYQSNRCIRQSITLKAGMVGVLVRWDELLAVPWTTVL